MSDSFNSFEEQQSIYPLTRDERAEYMFSPIIGRNTNNDQVQYSQPHIQQLTNERNSTTQNSFLQYINYDFNEQIPSNVHYSPTPIPHHDNINYIPTAQYSTSCSIPMQQYINNQNIDNSTSQYSSQHSILTQPFIYNSSETQQIYDKYSQHPILNLPLPHDILCDDSNTILGFRFEIPGFEIFINPSTFTSDINSTSRYSSQPSTLTQHYAETQQIYDFPHDNSHHIYRFDIPGFIIIINPLNLNK